MAAGPAGREFFTVQTVGEALRSYRPPHRTGIETVALDDLLGRVAAGEVRARGPLPGFDRSSVDGYAVLARDTFGASEGVPAYLRVTGAVSMGAAAPERLVTGTAISVPTGGALPEGADAVVMVEHTLQALPGTIEVVRPVAPGDGIVRADEDVAAGEVVLAPGRPARAQDVAMLAACGITSVAVHARPRVRVIATGDEVVAPEVECPGPAQVRDALSVSVAALVREAGGEPAGAERVRDDPAALAHALRAAVADSDLVVVCAGSSVGARDGTLEAVMSLPRAELFCHGLAIKPGKPTLLASSERIPILGLPGNPRSALVVFRLLGMPVVRRVGGVETEPLTGVLRRRLARDLPSSAGRLDVVQVRLRGGEAEPIFGSSALLSVLTAADGYVIVPEDANGLAAGEAVDVLPYG